MKSPCGSAGIPAFQGALMRQEAITSSLVRRLGQRSNGSVVTLLGGSFFPLRMLMEALLLTNERDHFVSPRRSSGGMA